MTTFAPRHNKKYNRKNYYVTKPSIRRKSYRNYYHPQPSKRFVYVEEPDSEQDEDEISSEEEVYEFNLDDNNEASYEDYSDSEISSDDEYIIDLNDELVNDAIDRLEAEGKVYDLNDELVRYYDGSSEDESGSEESEPEDILDVIDLNDQLQAEALRQITGASSESETESETDDELGYVSDEDELNDQLQIENVRQVFIDDLVSEDEVFFAESEDSELDSDPEFIEIDSDMSTEDSESEIDVGNPEYYEFDDESSESDSSDDDEGITIYKHRFDLPNHFESENDSTDEELIPSDDDYDEQFLLRANDSEDEVEIIDLSKDLEDSKDCELIELDENNYKLTIRFPSLVREELNIKFLKRENELVISGKFNFSDVEESDNENDPDFEMGKGNDNETNEWSGFEEDQDREDEEADKESEQGSNIEISAVEGSESDFESDEEELKEDAESLIKDFENHEIKFEKHFQFDKIIKFDEIKAKFLRDGEFELIIPNENTFVKDDNIVPIKIDSGVVEEQDKEEESVTDEIEENGDKLILTEKEEQFEDASMEN